jgi:hypothetical protein
MDLKNNLPDFIQQINEQIQAEIHLKVVFYKVTCLHLTFYFETHCHCGFLTISGHQQSRSYGQRPSSFFGFSGFPLWIVDC